MLLYDTAQSFPCQGKLDSPEENRNFSRMSRHKIRRLSLIKYKFVVRIS